MKYEPWFVGSHRTVDRLIDGKRVAVCAIYSGAADNLDQADEFQRLIAAAPGLLNEVNRLSAIINMTFDDDIAKIITLSSNDLVKKITNQKIL